jgi:hypothetical protein
LRHHHQLRGLLVEYFLFERRWLMGIGVNCGFFLSGLGLSSAVVD